MPETGPAPPRRIILDDLITSVLEEEGFTSFRVAGGIGATVSVHAEVGDAERSLILARYALALQARGLAAEQRDTYLYVPEAVPEWEQQALARQAADPAAQLAAVTAGLARARSAAREYDKLAARNTIPHAALRETLRKRAGLPAAL